MRRIEDAMQPDCRSECTHEFGGDVRADAAFELCVMWLKLHPLPRGADRQAVNLHQAHLRHAVEVKGRNDNVCGDDVMEWFEIVNSVAWKVLGWLIEAPQPVCV